MANTKYEFSITNDFPYGKVNTTRLADEISESSITRVLDYINSYSNVCDIWFKDELTISDETTLSGVINNHSGEPPEEIEPPHMEDGRPIVRADTRPLDTATYFTCASDTASGIGNGAELRWDFSDPETYPTMSGGEVCGCGYVVPIGFKSIIIDLYFRSCLF